MPFGIFFWGVVSYMESPATIAFLLILDFLSRVCCYSIDSLLMAVVRTAPSSPTLSSNVSSCTCFSFEPPIPAAYGLLAVFRTYIVVFIDVDNYVVVVDGGRWRSLQPDSTLAGSTLLTRLHVHLAESTAVADGDCRVRETLVA